MAETTGIEWADATFNPWWGCEKISPACAHCYAERDSSRFHPDASLWGPGSTRRMMSDAYWQGPLRLNAQSESEGRTRYGGRPDERIRVFTASMADVFEDRPDLDAPRRRLFDLIAATPSLDWLVLTKRPDVAARWLRQRFDDYWNAVDHRAAELRRGNRVDGPDSLPWSSRDGIAWGVHPNLRLGVSIENNRHTYRADVLRTIPAPVRFVSAEPLLGSLFEQPSSHCPGCGAYPPPNYRRAGECPMCDLDPSRHAVAFKSRRPLDLSGIDWVIAGGESGPRARPTHPAWLRELRDACLRSCTCRLTRLDGGRDPGCERHTAFLFKQWGEYRPGWKAGATLTLDADGRVATPPDDLFLPDGWETVARVGKRSAGRDLDGRTWDEFPEVAR